MKTETFENLKNSEIFTSIFSKNYKDSVECAAQFGMAIFYNKPVYLIVPNSMKGKVPEKVIKFCDGLVYFDEKNPESLREATSALGTLLKSREKP